jgi:hypothetical protein
MKEYKKLLLSNKAWASERLKVDEHYFDDLSKDQNPLFLSTTARNLLQQVVLIVWQALLHLL